MNYPKSYLSEEARHNLIEQKRTQSSMCFAESWAAFNADDLDTAWEWMRFVDIPAHALMSLKRMQGSQFIRDKKLDISSANECYGSNWLNNNE